MLPLQLASKRAEAKFLPKALLTDIDINWLQTIGEGWAAPLKGFMREGALVQTLHHNSILVDPHNVTGNVGATERPTPGNWNGERPDGCHSMPKSPSWW